MTGQISQSTACVRRAQKSVCPGNHLPLRGLKAEVVIGAGHEFRELGNGESCVYFANISSAKQATHSSFQILLRNLMFSFSEKEPALQSSGKIQYVRRMTSAPGLNVRGVEGANCLPALLRGAETQKPSDSCHLSPQRCLLILARHSRPRFTGKNQFLA